MKKISFSKIRTKVRTTMTEAAKAIKEGYKRFRLNSPHYLLRAIAALVCTVYLLYLLKSFLTIPVKDYYIDIYSVSPDSLVAQVDLTIGHDNLLNTYSMRNGIKNDSFNIEFKCLKFQNPINRRIRYYLTEDVHLLSIAMDSIAIYSMSCNDTIYNPLLKTYNHYRHHDFLQRDTMSTYIYTHLYENLSSSDPIGYIESYNDSIKLSTPINSNSDNQKDKKYNILLGGGVMSPFICSMNLSLFSDSSSYKKLSKNHNYLNFAKFVRIASWPFLKIKDNQLDIEHETISGGFGFAHPQPNYAGLYRFFPRLSLLLYKEDISQAFFRFSMNTNAIDSYTINLHSRGGAIVQNNPSDELKVLSLHDTQITKSKHLTNNSDYTDTELFISFPENSNIQYLRLFFVTLIIGWLMLSFCRNIWKLISHKDEDNKLKIKN